MKIVSSSVVILTSILVGVVYAHSGATGIVKERMDAMKDMGDQSKIVADMFKGKSAFDKNTLLSTTDSFIKHGGEMAELFPDTTESRQGAMTEALPKIWEEWDEFSEKVSEFEELSRTLKSTAESTDDVGELRKAFFKTTKSCSGCHKRFRKPKN